MKRMKRRHIIWLWRASLLTILLALLASLYMSGLSAIVDIKAAVLTASYQGRCDYINRSYNPANKQEALDEAYRDVSEGRQELQESSAYAAWLFNQSRCLKVLVPLLWLSPSIATATFIYADYWLEKNTKRRR